jgi:carbon-monoxide dehydrogenase medium subunit
MDIAVAGVAVRLTLSEDGRTIEDAALALAAVAPVPLRATDAEELLTGEAPTPRLFDEVAELAQRAASPVDDVRGSARFRTHLVGVLARRALRDSLRRARKEVSNDG